MTATDHEEKELTAQLAALPAGKAAVRLFAKMSAPLFAKLESVDA